MKIDVTLQAEENSPLLITAYCHDEDRGVMRHVIEPPNWDGQHR